MQDRQAVPGRVRVGKDVGVVRGSGTARQGAAPGGRRSRKGRAIRLRGRCRRTRPGRAVPKAAGARRGLSRAGAENRSERPCRARVAAGSGLDGAAPGRRSGNVAISAGSDGRLRESAGELPEIMAAPTRPFRREAGSAEFGRPSQRAPSGARAPCCGPGVSGLGQGRWPTLAEPFGTPNSEWPCCCLPRLAAGAGGGEPARRSKPAMPASPRR